ncbi:MAG: family 78 glycoside hydrolase catalytic domain [Polaribacter sp.]
MIKKIKNYLIPILCLVGILFWFINSNYFNSNTPKGKVKRAQFIAPKKIDWNQAKWIGYTQDNRIEKWSVRDFVRNQPPMDINTWQPTEKELKAVKRKAHPSVLLRKSFSTSKEIAFAEVAICGLGLYELYLNGSKVGDRVLDPAQTSYNKRAFFVRYNVTSLLKEKNGIGIMLGNGFYGQNIAFWPGLAYGKPRAIMVLNITYKDGKSQQVVTDKSWKAHNSPILFDNMYLGETYDARKEIKNWSSANYKDSSWNAVEPMKVPTSNLIEQQLEPMKKVRKIEPVAILPAEKGWIIDMGQNITGWLQINVEEKEGTEIKMRFAEHLMPDKQNIDPASTGIHVTGNTQTDIYICKGNGVESWEPRFTYHGFQYIQIEGLTKKPTIEQFTGWLVRTDVERIGTFKCSDEQINKFYNVSMLTIEDNLQGLLSDCPHRERCAWMGDAYVVAEAASYNFNLQRLWQKTTDDMETVLGVSKAHFKDPFPYDKRAPANVSVGKRLNLQARPDWGAATVMIPYFSYVYYGDTTIVKKSWKMMQGWMAYLDEKVQEKGIINGGYGDWCPPGGNPQMDTPPALTTTALYYQSLLAMQKMADLLNKNEASTKYKEKASFVKKAFNNHFFDAKNNSYGSQTGNAFALHLDLVDEKNKQLVADDLAKRIMKDKQGHFTTGIFGHRPLYTILNDFGHSNVTQHLWTITDYPSLGFVTETHNLSTWPELIANWNKSKRYYRNSFNHPMNSGFAASFHESLGGIRPNENYLGFKQFFLKPTFLDGLDWVEVSYKSPQGKIESSWKKEDAKIIWSVTIPNNSKAIVQLPMYARNQIKLNNKVVKANEFQLESGSFTITIN